MTWRYTMTEILFLNSLTQMMCVYKICVSINQMRCVFLISKCNLSQYNCLLIIVIYNKSVLNFSIVICTWINNITRNVDIILIYLLHPYSEFLKDPIYVYIFVKVVPHFLRAHVYIWILNKQIIKIITRKKNKLSNVSWLLMIVDFILKSELLHCLLTINF